MPRKLKQFLYANFWWCAPVVLVVGAITIVRLPSGQQFNSILALAGAIAGAFYFLQKQQLGELELFHVLFADFNRRYASMNKGLQQLRVRRSPLSPTDGALLEDYFNLCAEEYFYYARGIIDSRVWCAWCRGMLQYLDNPRIAEFWSHEQSNGSYYGLTRATILAGARGPRFSVSDGQRESEEKAA